MTERGEAGRETNKNKNKEKCEGKKVRSDEKSSKFDPEPDFFFESEAPSFTSKAPA